MTILKMMLTVVITLAIFTVSAAAEPGPQSAESKSQSADPAEDRFSDLSDDRVKIEFVRQNGDLFTADVKIDEELWMRLQADPKDLDIQVTAPAGAGTVRISTCSEEKDLIQKQKDLLEAYEEQLDKLKLQLEKLEASLRKQEQTHE